MATDSKSTNYLAKTIDHTLLKPEATLEQIEKLVETAKTYGFCSVCINPCFVATASEMLKGSDVKVCTVVGFPLGANSPATKAFETAQAIKDGAQEIDMVINVGALKSKRNLLVEEDIRAVVNAAEGHTVKVIIETALLTKDEIKLACEISQKAGANFVKTSTGFNGGGATVEDIELMKASIKAPMQIKASGGIKDLASAQKLLAAGATRLGTSSGVAIIEGQTSTEAY